MKQKLKPSFSEEEGKKFVQDLYDEAMKHRALSHPYLQALNDGSFPDPLEAIKDFGFQYLAYSRDFLRYLTATISQLEDRKHREQLIHNLTEEAGQVSPDDEKALNEIQIDINWIQGVPHPDLFIRFLDGLGMDQEWRSTRHQCDEARVWSAMFLNCCASGGPAQAIGAMGVGTESIVKFIYRPILDAITKHTTLSREQRVFFDLHAALDDEHGEVMMDIAAFYAQYRRYRAPLRTGMLMALNLRTGFFDAMKVRAEAMPAQKGGKKVA